MSPVDSGFRERLQAAIRLWIEETRKHILRGQNADIISKELSAKAIAEFIVIAHEGFYGLIKGVNDPAIYKSLAESLNLYFRSIEMR